MAALTVVPFMQMQHSAKMSVLQQATINSKDDTRDIIIPRRKMSMSKPKSSSKLINNNTYTTNNNVKQEIEDYNCDSRVKKKPPAIAARGGGGGVIRSSPLPTISVARRNARERNRVQQVNKGFETLRQHIPASVASAYTTTENTGRGGSKKLSKVETLRMAVEYIRSLQKILATNDPDGHIYEQSIASPLSLVSTSPAPSTVSQNPPANYVDDLKHESSPGAVNEEVKYDDADSRDSFVSQVTRYASLAPQRAFGFYKATDYRDEFDEGSVPVPFINSKARFINLMEFYDRKDMDDKNLFETYGLNYGVKQLTPIHHNPSASLSPGMYSEQSLSPAEVDSPTDKPKYLPSFSKTLRPPLTSVSVNSVIQQTYHIMQQMPVKQEVKEEHVAGDGSQVDIDISWWEGDERIRTSPQ